MFKKNNDYENKPKILMKMDDEINIFREETEERYLVKSDNKKLINLAILLVILIIATVFLRYDFMHNTVTLARYLNSVSTRFEAFGRFIAGQKSVENINYSLYSSVIVVLVGAALGVCGTVYQGIFKNPMASPSMLGVQSGGMIGMVLFVLIAFEYPRQSSEFYSYKEYMSILDNMSFYEMYIQQIWTLVGCLLGSTLVISISMRAGRSKMSSVVMILAGSIFSSFANTFVNLAHYYFVMHDATTERIDVMMSVSMGSFSNLYSFNHLIMIGIPIIICIAIIFLHSNQLNLMTFGEEEARTLGLNVNRFRRIMFFVCTALCSVIISFCGQIGFVGLIVPHLARWVAGSNFRILLPCSALLGGITMILVYAAALCTGYTSSINIFTSIIGGIIFLVFILKYRRNRNADWS